MNKKRISLLLVFLMIFYSIPISVIGKRTVKGIKDVTVTGYGKTLEDARNDALRKAVMKVVGVFIGSKQRINNNELIENKILRYSNGYVKSYETIGKPEEVSKGIWKVKIVAFVIKGKVEKSLRDNNIWDSNIKSHDIYAEAYTKHTRKKQTYNLLKNFLKENFPFKAYKLELKKPIIETDLEGKVNINGKYKLTYRKSFIDEFERILKRLCLTEIESKEKKKYLKIIIDKRKYYIFKEIYNELIPVFFSKDNILLKSEFQLDSRTIYTETISNRLIRSAIGFYSSNKEISIDSKFNYIRNYSFNIEHYSKIELKDMKSVLLVKFLEEKGKLDSDTFKRNIIVKEIKTKRIIIKEKKKKRKKRKYPITMYIGIGLAVLITVLKFSGINFEKKPPKFDDKPWLLIIERPEGDIVIDDLRFITTEDPYIGAGNVYYGKGIITSFNSGIGSFTSFDNRITLYLHISSSNHDILKGNMNNVWNYLLGVVKEGNLMDAKFYAEKK